jgi:hypothetical protein
VTVKRFTKELEDVGRRLNDDSGAGDEVPPSPQDIDLLGLLRGRRPPMDRWKLVEQTRRFLDQLPIFDQQKVPRSAWSLGEFRAARDRLAAYEAASRRR